MAAVADRGVSARLSTGNDAAGILSADVEVLPVLARIFNASSQNWSDVRADWNERTDIISLTVFVVDGTGAPIEGAAVDVELEPADGSGGHPHAGRPKGTLFLPEENHQAQGRARETLALISDAAGEAEFVYRTSGVGGDEDVVVFISHAGVVLELRATVRIRRPGLVPMDRDGERHYFTPQGHTIHGDINHYIAPEFGAAVDALFADYFEDTESPRFLDGETRFAITEGTLEWGGLFDLSPWRNPHRTHRRGQDMDVRFWSMSQQQRDDFEHLCDEARVRCESHSNEPDPDPDDPRDWHYHLRPRS